MKKTTCINKAMIIVLMIALVISFPVIPIGDNSEGLDTVHAASTDPVLINIEDHENSITVYNEDNKTYAATSGGIITSTSISNGIALTGESTSGQGIIVDGSKENSTINLTLDNISITVEKNDGISPIQLTGAAITNLKLKGKNILNTFNKWQAPLSVNEGNTITITKSGEGIGELTANASFLDGIYGAACACIGGDNNMNSGKITIMEGTSISAISTSSGAGVGGGGRGVGKDINILGGNINICVISSGNIYGSAAIGGGYNANGENINIYGGNIYVESRDGAGIGGGQYGEGKNINIYGGKIHSKIKYGTGIGGGYQRGASNINIFGGEINIEPYEGSGVSACIGGGINATTSTSGINISGGIINVKSINGSGIGAGYNRAASDINISGGSINAKSKNGAGIGSGSVSSSDSAISITGGFVNAESENGDGIGSGSGNVNNDKISVGGGSVVASGRSESINGFTTTPKAINSKDAYLINLEEKPGIEIGNKDLSVYIDDKDNSQYKFKTVKKQPNCEHGQAYTSAATIYLPEGMHSIMSGDKKIYQIKVDSDGSCKNIIFKADISMVDLTVPKTIYAGETYTFTASDFIPAFVKEDYEKLEAESWRIGTLTGTVTGGKGTFNIPKKGSYILEVIYRKSIYKNGTWQRVGTETKKESLDVITNTISIRTAQKNIYLKKGQSITLPLMEYTSDGSKTKLTYKSTKSKVVSVSSNGKVKAKKKGKSVVTVTAPNGKYCKFNIYVAKKGTKTKKVKVSGFKKTMTVGATKNLKVTISPKKATKAIATFKSSKPSVLSVDKAGKLTAKSKGKAKITVKAGGKKKVITIKVK